MQKSQAISSTTGGRLPKHVAIIMDGNGRWAQQRRHARYFGHMRGADRVRDIVREASSSGIKALSLYAFSTENWSRPPIELRFLWKLLIRTLLRFEKELCEQNVRLRCIGELDRLEQPVRDQIEATVGKLSGNTGMQLTFCLSYGSRRELSRAAMLFAEDCLRGLRRPEEMTEELMKQYLWTSELGGLSDVDLVIRTSGELRISNFLLWQSAYAEYYFTDLYWPDFRADDFKRALAEYASRERRFGTVPTAINGLPPGLPRGPLNGKLVIPAPTGRLVVPQPAGAGVLASPSFETVAGRDE